MVYTIKSGKHAASPWSFRPWVNKVSGYGAFIQAAHTIPAPNQHDQWDWSKLTGIGYNPLKPNDHACMVAWRWNLETKKVELSAYFNANAALFYETNPDNIISVDENQPFYYEITHDRVHISDIRGKSVTVFRPSQVKVRRLTSFQIQPWFGGNQTAPSDIIIRL